jgi:hypothetical protein
VVRFDGVNYLPFGLLVPSRLSGWKNARSFHEAL